MDLCQPRNLTVRTHPKHNTQKVWASLATGNMGYLCIQLPQLVPWHTDDFIRWKKCNRSCRVKKIDESLMGEQGESKVENRLRIEGKGIEKR